MSANEIIGKNIQRKREEAGVKQETLAKMIGITAGALSNIENGKADISVNKIEKIAVALSKNFYEIISQPNQVVSVTNSPNTWFNNTHATNTDPQLLSTAIETMNKVMITLDRILDK